jgi:hypothetical protein
MENRGRAIEKRRGAIKVFKNSFPALSRKRSFAVISRARGNRPSCVNVQLIKAATDAHLWAD